MFDAILFFMAIDWNKQWEEHAHGFKDGYAHISFADIGLNHKGNILLTPGPGFGDLSHPTTYLTLQMMAPYVENKRVLDLGCGSGILSLAAAELGAKEVVGIDIEEEAIIHAKQNADLNTLSKVCTFSKYTKKSFDILLMNMIRTEQKIAFETAHPKCDIAITSGILKSEKKRYLAQTASWGWKCQEIQEKNGWLGFRFKTLGSDFYQSQFQEFRNCSKFFN